MRNNSVFRAGMPDAPHRVIFSQRPGPDVAYCPPVDYDKGNANADLIVRAVNAHDSLVEALRWILNCASDVGKSGGPPEPGEFEAALDAGKAAIEGL